jgi:hypothetical protein
MILAGCGWHNAAAVPDVRVHELLNSSESSGVIEADDTAIERFTDEPGHLSPERVHGGIQ